MLMKVEWPWGEEDTLELGMEPSMVNSTLLTDLMRLSREWDVIIDNGVVTFVEKA